MFGDVYINFGALGVFILFPLFGWIVSYVEFYAKNGFGIFMNVAYIIILSQAVYWPRDAYFGSIRNICWALFITYIAYVVMNGRRVLSCPRFDLKTNLQSLCQE